MINLTIEEKRQIENYVRKGYSIKISGKNYFVKGRPLNILYNEIIAEKMARIAGINCAHYEVVKINDRGYFLSEDLNCLGSFISGEELEESYIPEKFACHPNSLYRWWEIFDYFYNKKSNQLISELVKIYLFDIILRSSDRNSGNWGVLRSREGEHIYILDNEHILISSLSSIKSSYEYESQLNGDATLEENLQDLDYFLKTSSSESIDVLKELMELLTPDAFMGVLEDVEKEQNDIIFNKDKLVSIYKDNYEKIRSLIESRGNNGKRIH